MDKLYWITEEWIEKNYCLDIIGNDDDFDFAERFTKLKAEFEEQLKEEARLNELIKENLAKIEIPEKKA